MTNEEQFVNELIGYIFAYPDDDYMTMECLCRKLVKHGLLDKADGYYQTHEIRTDTHECVKDTHDKTENSSEIPNNCEDLQDWKDRMWAEAIVTEPQTNADQHVQRVEYVGNDGRCRCWKCKHFEEMHETPIASDGRYYTYVVCTASRCHYEPKDEPQTEPLQTCSVNGRPYSECHTCGNFRCMADVPQTEREGE